MIPPMNRTSTRATLLLHNKTDSMEGLVVDLKQRSGLSSHEIGYGKQYTEKTTVLPTGS